jgi:hypothetical protein
MNRSLVHRDLAEGSGSPARQLVLVVALTLTAACGGSAPSDIDRIGRDDVPGDEVSSDDNADAGGASPVPNASDAAIDGEDSANNEPTGEEYAEDEPQPPDPEEDPEQVDPVRPPEPGQELGGAGDGGATEPFTDGAPPVPNEGKGDEDAAASVDDATEEQPTGDSTSDTEQTPTDTEEPSEPTQHQLNCAEHCVEIVQNQCEGDSLTAEECEENCDPTGASDACREANNELFNCIKRPNAVVCRDGRGTSILCGECDDQLSAVADACEAVVECVF